MNGTPSLRAETGTRERQLVSALIPRPHAAGSTAKDNSMTTPALVELVLRRRDGMFLPVSYLLNTLCHEVCSDRSRIGVPSHLRPRYFDYAISLDLNHL